MSPLMRDRVLRHKLISECGSPYVDRIKACENYGWRIGVCIQEDWGQAVGAKLIIKHLNVGVKLGKDGDLSNFKYWSFKSCC